jgi:hypothetical protein
MSAADGHKCRCGIVPSPKAAASRKDGFAYPAEGQYPSGYKIQRTIDRRLTNIELTKQELYDAFLFRERLFRQDDIRNTLAEMEEGEELDGMTAQEITEDETLFERMVSLYAKNCDKHGLDWYYAARNAVVDVLAERRREREAI